jgi:hypothetical protein
MLTRTEQLEKSLKRIRLSLSFRPQNAFPAFIFGAQRSGTDMVASVFNRSAEVECYNESDPEAFDSFVLRSQGIVTTLARKSRARAVFFKSILNSQDARALLDLDANAKAIWLFRPYADVINSNLKRFKSHYRDLTEMLHEPEKAGWRVANVSSENLALVRKFHDKGVSDASARALLWYLRNQLLFQQELERDRRVLIANYDSIVTDRAASFARIFAFFGLPFSKRYTDHVLASSVGKDAAPDMDPEIRELCDSMMQRLKSVATL